jgi:hypothetical protein
VSTEDTARVARAYHDAWTNRRGTDAVRGLMDEAFTFVAGPLRLEGREAFLAALAWPPGATTTMQAEAYDGDDAFQLYEAVNGHVPVRIAEHLTVRDGRVTASEIIVDGAAFGAFAAAG